MSAFMHTDTHFAAIAGTFLVKMRETWGTPIDASNGKRVADMLAHENRRSVEFRYEPGAFGTDPIDIDVRLVEHFIANPLTTGEFVKAIDSYSYQSCETNDWPTTEAAKFCVGACASVGANVPPETRDTCPVRNMDAYIEANTWSIADYVELPEPTESAPEPEPVPEGAQAAAEIIAAIDEVVDGRDPLAVDVTSERVIRPLAAFGDRRGDDSDELVGAILDAPEAGEAAAFAVLATCHRGQMRRAAVALGLVTLRESRKLSRPVVEAMLHAHIVRVALGLAV